MIRMWGLIAGNPWLVMAVLVALTGSHTYVYVAGKDNQKNADNTEKLAAVSRAIQEAQAIAKQDMEVASANIQTVEVIRDRTRTIRIKEAAHAKANPLPANCVLDPDRMRNIRAALAGGEVATDTGKLDYRMPEASQLGR